MSKVSRYSVTSSLLKCLVGLKILHGGKSGAKGATLEEISMHLVKTYNIDGDIKSQVLASLKYGVKLNFIEKKKDKFILVIPGSGIHLAPCKAKPEEIERVNCIFPPIWETSCNSNTCATGIQSCCGKRKSRKRHPLSCDKEPSSHRMNRGGSNCPDCSGQDFPPPKPKRHRPCPSPSCSPRRAPCGNQPCGGSFSSRPEYCNTERPASCNRAPSNCYNPDEDDSEDDYPPVSKNCSCCFK